MYLSFYKDIINKYLYVYVVHKEVVTCLYVKHVNFIGQYHVGCRVWVLLLLHKKLHCREIILIISYTHQNILNKTKPIRNHRVSNFYLSNVRLCYYNL